MKINNKEIVKALSNPSVLAALKNDQKLNKELTKISKTANKASILASPALIGAILGLANAKYKSINAKNLEKDLISGSLQAYGPKGFSDILKAIK